MGDPIGDLLDGMGECLKSGIIGDPWLWKLIKERGNAALADGAEERMATSE